MSRKDQEFMIKVYEEICTNIRTTDEVSFNLLRLIPILSGTGVSLLSLLEHKDYLSTTAIVLISIFAATLTYGLFRWELRNIQHCSWLIKRGAHLEKLQFTEKLSESPRGQFQNREDAPALTPIFGERKKDNSGKPKDWLRHPIGKTEAEKIIYMAAMAAWIIPVLLAIMPATADPAIATPTD